MRRYYSLETIRANAYDVTLSNGAKHRCIDPDALLDIEPADVRENVKGEWTEEEHADFYINATFPVVHCNRCDYRTPRIDGLSMNFCPNCGADMRGGDAE